MTYRATVIPIMIASPGDVLEERRIVRDVIHEWNYINSLSTSTVLMPIGWETHSSPELGGRPQELINERILKNCDLLIGIFWTRLGTPTGKSSSGTAEEIERHLDSGKPAMVYFSTAPFALQSINHEQFNALTDFRNWCQSKGLVETFENIVDFRQKFSRQLQITLKSNPFLQEAMRNAEYSDDVNVLEIQPPHADFPGSSLSEEAKQLLFETTLDTNGLIMMVETMSGRHIQTNGKTFGDPTDRRSMARWEYALRQLVSEGLVVERGYKDEIFEVTESGYQLADILRPSQT